ADALIAEAKKRTNLIFIDFHAEATSEMQALGWYVDGRASAVVGRHTHVQTADERVLPEGTAYIRDVGRTGPSDGILGVQKDAVINRSTTSLPGRLELDKKGSRQLNGAIITVDDKTSKAMHITRTLITGPPVFHKSLFELF